MNRTDRLYAIVEELRAAGGDGRTGGAARGALRSHRAHDRRDVSALQQSGVPIWATSGPGGGYGLDAAATLPPLTFTVGEATAVAIALSDPTGPSLPARRPERTDEVDGRDDPRRARVCIAARVARVWLRSDGDAARRTRCRARSRSRCGSSASWCSTTSTATVHARRSVLSNPWPSRRRAGAGTCARGADRRRAGRWFRLDRVAGAWPTTEAFTARDVVEVFGEPPENVAPSRSNEDAGQRRVSRRRARRRTRRGRTR